MIDIAVAWDPATLRLDWVFDGNDLAATDTLQSAVIVSLLTDRLANADDEIPDGTNDRRGWWADMALPLANTPPAGDLIGSRLWLLSRRKVVEQTRLDAISYTQEALQWLIDDGVAAKVDVAATFRREVTGWLDIAITIYRTDAATGRTATESYSLAWSAMLGVPLDWS
ncbi:MAG: phage GP46 family protein [Acetobacteraceae bacterium]